MRPRLLIVFSWVGLALASGGATAYLIDKGWLPAVGGGSAGYNVALGKPAAQSSRLHEERGDEAQLAVDGVVSGSYAFHTKLEPSPWWQVDLLHDYRIAEVVVYNSPGATAERAYGLEIAISTDGERFRTIYRNEGKPFGGKAGKPLRVGVGSERARFVRLQLAGENYLHLDEVMVIGLP